MNVKADPRIKNRGGEKTLEKGTKKPPRD